MSVTGWHIAARHVPVLRDTCARLLYMTCSCNSTGGTVMCGDCSAHVPAIVLGASQHAVQYVVMGRTLRVIRVYSLLSCSMHAQGWRLGAPRTGIVILGFFAVCCPQENLKASHQPSTLVHCSCFVDLPSTSNNQGNSVERWIDTAGVQWKAHVKASCANAL
jgi:hypothetical protein